MANNVHELWEQNVVFPSSLAYLTSGPLEANVPMTAIYTSLKDYVLATKILYAEGGLITSLQICFKITFFYASSFAPMNYAIFDVLLA